ncbi:MAG: hypothetical protein GXP43_03040 [bacterium]|nr:hypothetical protein [bacterium]
MGNNSLIEIAKKSGKHERTLRRWFKKILEDKDSLLLCSSSSLFIQEQPIGLAGHTLILDATYLKTKAVVLIARDLNKVIGCKIDQRENYQTWSLFLNELKDKIGISSIKIVVIDGKKGLIQAVKDVLGERVRIQRCLFHIHLLSRVYLTSHPKTQAGYQLKRLIHQLFKIKTKASMSRWLISFFSWLVRYTDFLQEKTYHPIKRTITGKKVWYYKHKKLRSAFNLIKHALPYLFTFLDYPGTPKTTNHLEGGVNARLKELIYRHRGLAFEKQKILIRLFLQSRM